MLLLYRVEGRNEPGQWETIRVCRPPYQKTETHGVMHYGFFKLRKRRIVIDSLIHNEDEAIKIAFNEAKRHMRKNRDGFQKVRISATHRIDDDLETVPAYYGD